MFLACVLTIAIVAIVKSSICFIVKSLGLHLAKIRLSERNTKEKYLFLLYFRARVPSTDRSKDTNKREKYKRKSQIFFVSIFATQLQRYFSFHTSSLKSDADIICPEGCCAGRSWWFTGVRECKFYILDDFQRSLFIIICKGCESSELFGNDCVKFLVRRFFLN